MLTKFEAEMIVRAVEALRRIADNLARICALLEQKSPEGRSEGKEQRNEG